MKVLFYRYGSICEPFILKAFETLGIAVTELDKEISDKSIQPSECVKLVSSVLMSSSYDFVFTVNFFPAISDVCNILHIPYISWTVDSPVMELYSKSITNSCNYIFLFDQCQYQDIAPLNPGHIYYLPLATDPDYMQSVVKGDTSGDKFTSKLSFVGSLYTEKCPYDRLVNPPAHLSGFLDGLMEAQLKVYGYYFVEEVLSDSITAEFKAHMPDFYAPLDAPYLTDKTIAAQYYIGNKITSLERIRLLTQLAEQFPTDIYTGSDTSGIPQLHKRGLVKTLTEMPLVFHNSTINLNFTSKPIRSGIPLRIWDIAGCGGFIITNFQAELPEYFTPGEDIEVYESADDLMDKCGYYLENPKRAKEIAQNGLENILAHHTYTHRIEEMLRIVSGNR